MTKQILVVKDRALRECDTAIIRYIEEFDPQVIYYGHLNHESLLYSLSVSCKNYHTPVFNGFDEQDDNSIDTINAAYIKMQHTDPHNRILVVTGLLGFLACNIGYENARTSMLLEIALNGPEAYKVKDVSFHQLMSQPQTNQTTSDFIM